jgi:hypothetical protein
VNHRLDEFFNPQGKEPVMKSHYKNLYWVLAIVAALSFDQLFWQKPGGINFFLFVLVALLGGLIPLWLDKVRVPWTAYLLLLPIFYFAGMTVFRAEPTTTAMNGLITLGSVILFTITVRNGEWMRYNLKDHLVNLFKFALNCFAGGILFFVKVKPAEKSTEQEASVDSKQEQGKPVKKWLPYLRGVLIAIPILIVLALLLSAADPVFSNRLGGLFNWFDIDHLGEYIFRLVYVFVIAYLLLGAYYFGLVDSEKLTASQKDKMLVKPFLGTIESTIILGAVNLLFLLFVVLQFTYLFGGTDNISVTGFTYAEYARRGFFELLAVAVLSLGLFYVLSQVTQREKKSQRWLFSILGIALVAQVGVILASAYTRLSLYEQAYGFTRLRTFTHFFILWLGILLAVVAILDLTRNLNRLPLVLILFILGFGITINLVNVDRFITEQNISRVVQPQSEDELYKLDTGHLYILSYDSIPPLVSFYNDPTIPADLHDQVGRILACRLASLELPERIPWSSWQASRTRAVNLLQAQADSLSQYTVFQAGGWFLDINGETISCSGHDEPYFD